MEREDEQQYGEYRTKRVILEIYDAMKRAMETGERYQTLLGPRRWLIRGWDVRRGTKMLAT